jgi:hypothetical protein
MLSVVVCMRAAGVTRCVVCVSTRQVQIKAIENCNYLVECAKALGCNIVNMGGKDIFDKNEKLVLALVWQLMRHDTMAMLESLGGGGKISDADLLAWANAKVGGRLARVVGRACLFASSVWAGLAGCAAGCE